MLGMVALRHRGGSMKEVEVDSLTTFGTVCYRVNVFAVYPHYGQ